MHALAKFDSVKLALLCQKLKDSLQKLQEEKEAQDEELDDAVTEKAALMERFAETEQQLEDSVRRSMQFEAETQTLREINQQLQQKIGDLTGDETMESLLNLKLRCLTQDHQAMKKRLSDLMLTHAQCDRIIVEKNAQISELRDDFSELKKKLEQAKEDIKMERNRNEKLVSVT